MLSASRERPACWQVCKSLPVAFKLANARRTVCREGASGGQFQPDEGPEGAQAVWHRSHNMLLCLSDRMRTATWLLQAGSHSAVSSMAAPVHLLQVRHARSGTCCIADFQAQRSFARRSLQGSHRARIDTQDTLTSCKGNRLGTRSAGVGT
jgi:hypothetical protein